jgi:hypothetical protein
MEDKIAIIILSDDDIVLLSECLNRIKENIKVCEYKIYLGYNSNSGKEQVENLMKNFMWFQPQSATGNTFKMK